VAITGPEALKNYQQTFNTCKKLSEQFKVKPEEIIGAVQRLSDENQRLQTSLKQLKKQLLKSQLATWQNAITTVGKVPFLYLVLDDASADDLKWIAQELEKTAPGLYVLLSKDATGRCSFIAYAAKGIEQVVPMKQLSQLLQQHELRGGGGGNSLQGGGAKVPAQLEGIITAMLISL